MIVCHAVYGLESEMGGPRSRHTSKTAVMKTGSGA